MASDSPTYWGVLSGLTFAVSAHAVNWFITPHPGASTLETWLVVAQLVVAAAVGVWALRRGRSLERGSPGAERPEAPPISPSA